MATRIYELILNGMRCDLYEGDITLKYTSPIFAELESIQSNRSYNIALPLTPRNKTIIELANRVDSNSTLPYKKTIAALYIDGVEMFTSGYAVITDIDEYINITLTWGNVNNFQTLFDNSLNDLAIEDNLLTWDDTTTSGTTLSDKVADFYLCDFGLGLSDIEYRHPSARVDKVIEAIEADNGITISDSSRITMEGDYPLMMPLVTKYTGSLEKEVTGEGASVFNEDSTLSQYTYWTLYWEDIQQGEYYTEQNKVGIDVDGAGTISFDSSVTEIDVNSKFRVTGNGYGTANVTGWIRLVASYRDGTEVALATATSSIDSVYIAPYAPEYLVSINIDDLKGEYDVDDDCDYVYLDVRTVVSSVSVDPDSDTMVTPSLSVSGHYGVEIDTAGFTFSYLSDSKNKLAFPSIYPIAVNLPDMTQGAFINELLTRQGLFCYPSQDNVNELVLFSADDLYNTANSTDAVDWSNRIVLNDMQDIMSPDSTEFEVGDFTQVNILDYDNDDEITVDTSGKFMIDNDKLDYEEELFTSEFSYTDTTSADASLPKLATIPLYSIDDDDDEAEAEYDEASPRICNMIYSQAANARYLTSPDKWSTILEEKFANYVKILQGVRLITLRVRLTISDIRALRFETAIWISQYGSYFALQELEFSGSEMCEVKLLRLNA